MPSWRTITTQVISTNTRTQWMINTSQNFRQTPQKWLYQDALFNPSLARCLIGTVLNSSQIRSVDMLSLIKLYSTVILLWCQHTAPPPPHAGWERGGEGPKDLLGWPAGPLRVCWAELVLWHDSTTQLVAQQCLAIDTMHRCLPVLVLPEKCNDRTRKDHSEQKLNSLVLHLLHVVADTWSSLSDQKRSHFNRRYFCGNLFFEYAEASPLSVLGQTLMVCENSSLC